jgi:hypothetical protein
MSTTQDSKAETIFGITAVTTTGGVLTFALFPLMLPGVVLVAALAIPLLPLVVVGAVAYGLVALSRRAWRLVRHALTRDDKRPRDRTRTRVRTVPAGPSTGRLAGR